MKINKRNFTVFMSTIGLYFMTTIICFGQKVSQFKTLQEDFASQNWNLEVNGIFLSKNVLLTARQFEFVNFEIGLIEIPVLLKIKVTDKLSIMSGVKFDFYRTNVGLASEVGVSLSTGLHYDLNNDMYLEGLFNYQINQTSNIYDYNFGSSSSFMLRSGYRF
ncbi:hypothetical protein [uncultured Winogradskyella sp.]|uniref:hypothetical protein n=1 Tax=uncultured Winogradskyella sp. TaxID=395353 RepID=UPI0030EF3CDD|tara:strand:+ start:723 stop:1208 length:486 start_codon:yes stop_codon:yes gene_type:complete